MKVNAEGIYNSHPLAPYKEKNICLTQQENGNTYFFYMAIEGENQLPETITIESHQPTKESKVTLLGSSIALKWKVVGKGFTVSIPENLRKNTPCNYVWTIKVSKLVE